MRLSDKVSVKALGFYFQSPNTSLTLQCMECRGQVMWLRSARVYVGKCVRACMCMHVCVTVMLQMGPKGAINRRPTGTTNFFFPSVMAGAPCFTL